MRITPLNLAYHKTQVRGSRVHKHSHSKPSSTSENVQFKGNVGKVVGLLAGTAAVCVFAPALAAVGLAGVGALPGMIAGAYVDEEIKKIDEDY